MSLEQVMAWARKSGDVDVIFYETATSFQVCVGNPLYPHAQRLKRFPPDRKDDAAAWAHRTILMLYPRSRYAAGRGQAAPPGTRHSTNRCQVIGRSTEPFR